MMKNDEASQESIAFNTDSICIKLGMVHTSIYSYKQTSPSVAYIIFGYHDITHKRNEQKEAFINLTLKG